MRSVVAVLVLVAFTSLAPRAEAQAPPALPARLQSVIELPGSGAARYLHATIDLGRGLPWAIVGCVTSAQSGGCRRTSRVELDDAGRRELVQRIAAVQERLRCPPPRPAPGDPTFTIGTPNEQWSGSLPRDVAQIPSRTGTCAASAALAWWIVERFGAG